MTDLTLHCLDKEENLVPRKNQYVIVACARGETENLTEWLVYHRCIGFDHVYLYCNDDEPYACWELLQPFIAGPDPFVTFVHFPIVGATMHMYRHFLKHRIHDVGWFIFLDVNEFLAFRKDGSVGDFLAERQQGADMIFFNSLVFGDAGLKERPTGSVLLSHTWRSRYLSPKTKVLTRARTVNAARYIAEGRPGFWHDWDFCGENVSWAVNVLSEDMSNYFGMNIAGKCAFLEDGERSQRIIATAVIHHYRFRSEDDISSGLTHGGLGEVEEQFSLREVLETGDVVSFLRQFSEVQDTSLHDYWRGVLNSWR